MDTFSNTIIQWVTNQGIGVIMLAFAVYYLNSQNKKALDSASAERNAKLDQMKSLMEHLGERVKECETDRRSLWIQVVDLAKKQSP